MPSRKIISILILATALVSSIILASGKPSQASKNSILALPGPTIKTVQTDAADTGEWKKDLNILPTNAVVATSSTSSNLTDQLSQSLLANYLAMKQQGSLTADNKQTLINQATNLVKLDTPTKYTSANIILSADNSQTAIRAYGSQLGKTFKLDAPVKPVNELIIFNQMVQNKNSSGLPQLKEVAQYYHQLGTDLSKVSVPSSYASLHLQMINGLEEAGDSVDNMVATVNDPLRAVQAIALYQKAYQDFELPTYNIKVQIKNNGVIYKQGESGYYFYYGL